MIPTVRELINYLEKFAISKGENTLVAIELCDRGNECEISRINTKDVDNQTIIVLKTGLIIPHFPAPSKQITKTCPDCGGDGIDTCDNPDHGFITAMGGELGRLGCPICGHDPDHKIQDSKCSSCDGKGTITSWD